MRAAGVSIGKVRAKRRDPDANRTLATIEIDRKYAPIRSDARAMLRQKTLLGETFVEMTLGSNGRAARCPRAGGWTTTGSTPTVELDEILDALDPFTRAGVPHLAARPRRQRRGPRARPQRRASATCRASSRPAATSSRCSTSSAGAGSARARTGVVFGALTEKEGQLRTLITAQDDVFTAIANEREAFAETCRIFPTFLDESKADLRAARLVLREGRARGARPRAGDARPRPDARLARRLRRRDLRRFFANFDPLITVSQRSLPATSEMLAGLKPVLDRARARSCSSSTRSSTTSACTSTRCRTCSPTSAWRPRRRTKDAPEGDRPLPAPVRPARRRDGRDPAEPHANNRGNAYLNPLGVLTSPEGAKFKILPSFDCRNAGGEKEPGGDAATAVAGLPRPEALHLQGQAVADLPAPDRGELRREVSHP